MTTSLGYEFNPSQNKVFEDLAKKMNLVGILLLFGGIFNLTIAIIVSVFLLFIQQKSIPISSAINGIIQGAFLALLGTWTRNAAVGFSRIVKTTNNDIENLMGAMGELRKLYTLQYFLAIITIVFIILVFIVSIVGSLSAT